VGSFGRALPPWPWLVGGWAPSVLLSAGKRPVGDLGQRRDPVPRVVTGKGQGFRDPPARNFSCSFCSFMFLCVLSFSFILSFLVWASFSFLSCCCLLFLLSGCGDSGSVGRVPWQLVGGPPRVASQPPVSQRQKREG